MFYLVVHLGRIVQNNIVGPGWGALVMYVPAWGVPAYINGRQIEAARQGIRRMLKRTGRLKILLLPDIGIINKSSAVRMGKRKRKVNN